jgi:acetoin utilization protein AcuB
MSEQVATVAPDTPAAAARQLMASRGIHHLAVVRDGALEGVLSARDIPDQATEGRRGGVAVSRLMHADVVTVGRNTLVTRAANLMAGHAIGSLIVTDRGRVVGIVTISDLLTLVARGAGRQPKRAARPALRTRVPHRKQHRAGGAW